MKFWLAIAIMLGLGHGNSWAQGAQADQIKRRARNVADQNNARQGVPPAHPPSHAPAPHSAPPPAAPIPATPLTAQQKSIASIRADLTALAANNSAGNRQKFSQTLRSHARGNTKPGVTQLDQLVEDLGAALESTKLASAPLDQLAKNLDALLNAGELTRSQTDALADDVKTVFSKAGAAPERAGLVASDLKRLAAAAQKTTGS